MPLRAEIQQNLIKIEQLNRTECVRFCLDFVGFLAEGDSKNPQKLKPLIFEEASSKGCSERRLQLFRRHLSHVPPSLIGGKVTAE